MKKLLSVLLIVTMLAGMLISCQPTVQSTNESTVPDTDTTVPAEEITEPEKVPITLNVMSLNIYYIDEMTTTGNDPSVEVDGTVKTRGPKLNALLEGEEIDLAGLQEFSAAWQRWLRDDLDNRYGFVGKFNSKDGNQITPLIYRKDRLKVMESGLFYVAPGAPETKTVGWDARFARPCQWGVFQLKETGEYLLFLNTHMDHEGSVARRKGAEVIVEQIGLLQQKVKETYGAEDCHVILVGDMNSLPTSPAYTTFTSVLQDSRVYSEGKTLSDRLSTSPGLYYCASQADYASNGHLIDYVFVSNLITVSSYKMVHTSTNLCPYGEYLSDHNAVIAKIKI
ncbi:MAG: endonuclease/exonuclease/phosphatase family protein [Clostridia bacterium]|nr:endonuclease/exonuclease/phosphatase family protein [Clostridia bacterium]